MKIVHLMYWYIPNMGYQENFLPMEQQKLGNDVHIITSNLVPFFENIKNNSRKLKITTFIENNVKIHRLPCYYEIKDSGQIIISGIKKKLREINPDILHCHGIFNTISILAILYQNKFKYKLFIDDHSHKGNFHINKLYKRLFVHFVSIYVKKNRNRINCLFPVQYSSKSILEKFFPNINMKLLHLGANENIFFPSNMLRDSVRNSLGIIKDKILIVTSGKFDENKDIIYLLNAFLKLDYNGKYVLLIIGKGKTEYMNKLREKINNENVTERVIFLDFLKNQELNKYYNAADIGIWPGDHSIGVIEAISSGLPVIVPESDKGYKILFENEAAIGFKRRNTNSLINSIKALSKSKAREKLRHQGLKLISNELSWTNIAKKSIHYYEKY